jgi:TolA-binding protein
MRICDHSSWIRGRTGNMSPDRSDDGALDPLAKRVAHFITGQIGPVSSSSSDPDALRWLTRARRSRRNRKQLTIGAAATVIVIAGALVGLRSREGLPARELSYRLDNAELQAGGYISVSDSAESLLAFSDGSKVRMSPRTRGRVVELSARGARFALESGKVSVDIVQGPRTHWVFQAGPFSVTVHGTSFTVVWNPVEAEFEMRLQKGTVSVSGPVGGSEVWLHAGQALKVSLRDQIAPTGTIDTRSVSAATNEAPDGTRPVAASPVYRPANPLPAHSSLHRWSNRSWKAVLAEGKAAAVLSDAERSGVPAVLEQADSEDLRALGNAARYAGRFSLAQQALVAQRRRFPGSHHAHEAAFFLGRLYDGASDGSADALRWYDRYMVEAPTGEYASDALGRKMTILQRWKREDEALDVARDYLRRFPDGTYANAARALVRALR